jgi:hypothetical protein
VPLHFRGYAETDFTNKLFVREFAEAGYDYGVGVDTGDGVGQDRSVMEGVRKGDDQRNDAQVCEFACLALGSMVVTPSGVVPIEDILTGDEVITRLGSTARVGAVKEVSRPESLAVATSMASSIPLHLTPEHRVATQEGWKEAKDLRKGDWIVYPVRRLTQSITGTLEFRYKHKPFTVELNRDFGFMCGLYLAEGSIGRHPDGSVNAVMFAIHKREAGPWGAILKRACASCYVGIHEPSSCKNARKLSISCASLGRWVAEQFGEVKNKRIPSWVWDAPYEFVEGLASGMFAGDGSIDRRSHAAVFGSVVPSLTVGIRDLVLSLGWGLGGVRRWKRENPKYSDFWIVNFYGQVAAKFCTEEMVRPLPKSRMNKSSLFRWGWNKQWIYARVMRIVPSAERRFIDINVQGHEPSFCVVQAAVHNSAYINAYDLSPLAYAVGCLYSPDPDYQAKMVIECNRNGESTQLELRKMGWTNFHQWLRYDNKRLRQSRATKLGWLTNVWSRPMMMDFLVKMLRDGWIDVFSPWFVGEMRDLERDENRQSLKACYGGFDDRIMALGFVLFSLHALELRGTQRGVLFERLQRQGEESGGTPSYPLYNPEAAYSRPILLEENQ